VARPSKLEYGSIRKNKQKLPLAEQGVAHACNRSYQEAEIRRWQFKASLDK
jgi:hypothetical protein